MRGKSFLHMKTTAFNHKVLRDQREKLGLSREDLVVKLAELEVRVSSSTIIRWEEGLYTPDAGDLPKIAQVLGCTVGTFYDGH